MKEHNFHQLPADLLQYVAANHLDGRDAVRLAAAHPAMRTALAELPDLCVRLQLPSGAASSHAGGSGGGGGSGMTGSSGGASQITEAPAASTAMLASFHRFCCSPHTPAVAALQVHFGMDAVDHMPSLASQLKRLPLQGLRQLDFHYEVCVSRCYDCLPARRALEALLAAGGASITQLRAEVYCRCGSQPEAQSQRCRCPPDDSCFSELGLVEDDSKPSFNGIVGTILSAAQHLRQLQHLEVAIEALSAACGDGVGITTHALSQLPASLQQMRVSCENSRVYLHTDEADYSVTENSQRLPPKVIIRALDGSGIRDKSMVQRPTAVFVEKVVRRIVPHVSFEKITSIGN